MSKLKRQEKKLLREKKYFDPYFIDDMSDEELEESAKSLKRKGIGRIVIGAFLLALIVVVLILMWNTMFYSKWFI